MTDEKGKQKRQEAKPERVILSVNIPHNTLKAGDIVSIESTAPIAERIKS